MNKRLLLASPHMSDEGYELEYINDAFRNTTGKTEILRFLPDTIVITVLALSLDSGTTGKEGYTVARADLPSGHHWNDWTKEELWELNFQKAQLYYDHRVTLPLSMLECETETETVPLYRWLTRPWASQKQGLLTAGQTKRLESVGMLWDR